MQIWTTNPHRVPSDSGESIEPRKLAGKLTAQICQFFFSFFFNFFFVYLRQLVSSLTSSWVWLLLEVVRTQLYWYCAVLLFFNETKENRNGTISTIRLSKLVSPSRTKLTRGISFDVYYTYYMYIFFLSVKWFFHSLNFFFISR